MDGCLKCNESGSLECAEHSINLPGTIRKVTMETFLNEPDRYELRKGTVEGAPNCPYGNKYQWIGYDLKQKEFVRFSKKVFKKLIQNL